MAIRVNVLSGQPTVVCRICQVSFTQNENCIRGFEAQTFINAAIPTIYGGNVHAKGFPNALLSPRDEILHKACFVREILSFQSSNTNSSPYYGGTVAGGTVAQSGSNNPSPKNEEKECELDISISTETIKENLARISRKKPEDLKKIMIFMYDSLGVRRF